MPEPFSFSPIYPDETVEQRTDAEGVVRDSQSPRITSGSAILTPSSQSQDAPTQGDSEPLPEPQTEGGVRKTGLQSRIDRLVRQKHQTASERDALKDEVSGLRQQLAGLQSALASATVRAPAASSRLGGDDGEPSGVPAFLAAPKRDGGAGASDISGLIREEIQKAISPLVQRNAMEEKIAKLREAHEASFVEAAEIFPDLRDQKSELRQVFNSLYDSRTDIAQLPDAPMLLAHMARGAVADQRRAEQRVAERKRGAALHVPQPVADPSGLSETKIKASAVAEAKQKLRSGLGTLADYKVIREAGREELAKLRQGQV